MADLEITGLVRRFRGRAALDGFSLRVADGELCVVVGPSGCGKSTLLRVVAGLESADAGTVRIGGEDVSGAPPRERDVAFVFQSYALYPHLTARGNIEFPLRTRHLPRAEREARVAEAARLLGIETLLDRRPAELSGGERQRVAIGRAVVRRPRLFLFDEPLSNLDARLRGRMRVELAELHRRLAATSLYVTHDQAEAMTLGDRVVVMHEGRIRQIGTPREVYEKPEDLFVAGFLGSPAMNLFEGELRASADGRRFRRGSIELPAPPWIPEGPVTLGVRPDALTAAPGGIAASVVLVEDLGGERFAHGRCGEETLVWKIPDGNEPPRPGDAVALAVRGPLHWFAGGRRLREQ